MTSFDFNHNTSKYTVVWAYNSSITVLQGGIKCGMLAQVYSAKNKPYQGVVTPDAHTLAPLSQQTCGEFVADNPGSIVIQGFETDPTLNPTMYNQTPLFSFIFNKDPNGDWTTCAPYTNFAMNPNNPSSVNQNQYACSANMSTDDEGNVRYYLYVTTP